MSQAKNLLPAISSVQNFGTPQIEEEERATIVVVIYDPTQQRYLCQYWKEYSGLTCLLSGGLEGNETPEQAVDREIAEETGLYDYEVVGRLGADIQTHYTKANGDHLVKHITPFYVQLHSLASKDEQKEDDEKFENLFKSLDEIVAMMSAYEQASGSTMEDHKEILRRGAEYINN